ncbi:MAG: cobalamin-dependent protein [Armatimonadota bacterium]
MPGTIVAGALGNCVHVAGVAGFLSIAEQLGYKTIFLGAAVAADRFVEAIERYRPEIVGISYRLTPDVGKTLLEELRQKLEMRGLMDSVYLFGGTPPMCKAAEEFGWFDHSFSGLENPDEVWTFLRGDTAGMETGDLGHNLLDRFERKHPYPLLRHHFGLPNLEDTVEGVRRIAESGVLDVISIAPDQNAQESFFRPEEMDPALDGAGGAPIRSAEDLSAIYKASRCGNHPLLRIYSGTRDLIAWAEVAAKTVANAWAAIPLCWYSALDGRSNRTPEDAIHENQAAMKWHALRSIPVEVNEAHHWALRDSHDVTSVVMAYLAAYNARVMGVNHYVSQYMFNTPAGISPEMDLAKIQAQIEMVESLHGPDFFSFREVRAGLLHMSPHLSRAKGQLAASTAVALAVSPHIIHVVGYCEGDHAATADEVIESCEIVNGVLKNYHDSMGSLIDSATVRKRKNELLAEAELLLKAISALQEDDKDPYSSSRVIARAIATGLLDAPHLRGNPYALGEIHTRIVDGAVICVDQITGDPVGEQKRLEMLALRKTTSLEKVQQ